MIKATIKNITEQQVLLELSSGEKISLNTKFLPTNILIGDTVIIEIFSKEDYQNKQNQNAKDTLNELLQA